MRIYCKVLSNIHAYPVDVNVHGMRWKDQLRNQVLWPWSFDKWPKDDYPGLSDDFINLYDV